MNVSFFSMNIPLCSWSLLCWFILFPYQAIDILSKDSLSADVESLRTKQLDKCINEEKEDVKKGLEKMQCIPLNIQSKLVVIFSI
jgi:hypothetical protein